MSLKHVIRQRGEARPQEPAYIFVGEGEPTTTLRSGDLWNDAARIGQFLAAPADKGDRALLLFPPGLDVIRAFWGCVLADVVPVIAYPPAPENLQAGLLQLNALAADASVRFVITTAALIDELQPRFADSPLASARWLPLESVREGGAGSLVWDNRPEDLAYLQYTSGSTSSPKGVLVTHGNLIAHCAQLREAFRLDASTVSAFWLPAHHSFGLVGGIVSPAVNGHCSVLMSPRTFLERPLRWLEMISRHRARISGGPGFAYDLCCRSLAEVSDGHLDLRDWEFAGVGGDMVRADTLRRFAQATQRFGFRPTALKPSYGMSETTLTISIRSRMTATPILRLDSEALGRNSVRVAQPGASRCRETVGLGPPLRGMKVLVVEPQTGRPCQEDRVGELWLQGPNVTAGYWGRQAETDAVFGLSSPDGRSGKYLRTGDLGFIHEGEIFITGRYKELIILRGLNHYPEDIEASAAEATPQLFGVAAFSVDDGASEQLVLVAESAETGPGQQQLRHALSERVVRAHGVRCHDIVLVAKGALPRTGSGKIRRAQVKRAYLDGRLGGGATPQAHPDGTDPARLVTMVETLRTLLATAMSVDPDRLPADRSLPELGVDSLGLVRFLSDVRTQLGAELTPSEVFTTGVTLTTLAGRLTGLAPTLDLATRDPAERAGREAPAPSSPLSSGPLSFGQQALFSLYRLDPASAAYNTPVCLRIKTRLDPATLAAALRRLVSDQRVLRTTFAVEDGEMVQRVAAETDPDFREIHLDNRSEGEVIRLIEEESQIPFALEREPPFRVRLYRRDADDQYLLLNLHHIVFDGVSSLVLVNDLFTHYADVLAGQERPRHTLEYARFVEAERSFMQSDEGRSALAAWTQALGGHGGILQLPTDRPRPARQTFNGNLCRFRVTRQQVQRLTAAASREGVTVSTALQTLFDVLLFRWSGERDLVLGVPASGRTDSRWGQTIGYFVNMLPVRAQIDEQASFWSLANQIQRTSLEALGRQNVPFSLIVQALQPPRDASRPPLFQVCFQHANWYKGVASQLVPAAQKLGVSPVMIDQQRGQFDLTLDIVGLEGELDCALNYNTDLFSAASMERMAGHYQNLLEAVLAAPTAPVATLDLLGADERQQVLFDWNATDREIADSVGLHQLFERRVPRQPDALALVTAGGSLSYSELDQQANRIARQLLELGLRPESKIGIFMPRTAEAVAALLGVLKAGCCYVPLDPDHPQSRRDLITGAMQIDTLITTAALQTAGRNTPGLTRLLCLDGPADAPGLQAVGSEQIAGQPGSNPAVPADPDGLAYVIFTSGTSGTPKGVAVRHRPVVNVIDWVNRTMRVGPGDRLLFVTSLCFDLSVYDVFGILAAGATIRVASREEGRDPQYLARLIEEGAVTFWDSAPAALAQVEPFLRGGPAHRLRTIFLSGDWIPLALARSLRAKFAETELIALGGATEATIWSNFHRVREIADDWASIPYGRPVQNAKYYILDGRLQPVPCGVPGDLYIGGSCLADGYANDAELTRAKFIRDPFSSAAGARMYRTGDRARFREHGVIEFLGRTDDQVKIRGFRIELGEIEAALSLHPAVAAAAAAVVHNQEDRHDARIVSYLTPRPGAELEREALLSHLQQLLPAYMLPSELVFLSELPMTPNGKLDRKALPAVAPRAARAAAGGWETGTERRLAEIWKRRLRLEQLGPEDRFFDCGGNSLSAVAVITSVAEELGVEIPLRVIFERPTVRQMAAWIDEQPGRTPAPAGDAASDLAPASTPGDGNDSFPLTDLQQAYWLGQGSAFELGEIRPHLYLEFDTERFVVQDFERAWSVCLDRHPMLRAVVLGEGKQQVLPGVGPLPISWNDLRHRTAAEIERHLADVREQMRTIGPATDRWPLFEVRVSQLADRDRLHFSISLLICDGMSLGILFRDWFAAYSRRSLAPAPAVGFRDVIAHLGRLKDSPAYTRARRYWLERIPSLPGPPPLPVLGREAGGATFLNRRERHLDADRWSKLRQQAARWSLTPTTLLCTAYAAALATWSGTNRFTLVLMYFNRRGFHQDVDRVVGNFSTTNLLEIELRPQHSFRDNAAALQRRLIDDLEASAFSGVELVRELRRQSAQASGSSFPVTFASGLDLFDEREVTGSVPGTTVYSALQVPQVWIDHQVYQDRTGRLQLRFDVAEELFPPGMIDDLLQGYVDCLDRVCEASGEQPLAEWSMVPRAHLELQARANATAAPTPEGLLDSAFRAFAAAHPGRPALVTPQRTLSAGELIAAADSVAEALCRRGVQPGELVPIVAEKGWEQVVACLGAFRAGAGYVPLAPGLPAARLGHCLAEVSGRLVLTQEALAGQLTWPAGLEPMAIEALAVRNVRPPDVLRSPDDIAYVIYTSGSTGKPKGVVLDHRGPLNTIVDVNRRFGVGPDDRVLSVSALSFDLSVYDLFGLLAAGGAVVMPSADQELDPRHWEELMVEAGVTIWNSAPQLMRMLLDFLGERPSPCLRQLRLCLLSGDWVPVDTLQRLRAAGFTGRLISLGGATEASIWSIYHEVTSVGDRQRSIPYGRPLANQHFQVLGPDRRPCPVWVKGELYIGGQGLAREYWLSPALSRERFLEPPDTPVRLYRTGDWGRYQPDGEIEFLGREDSQVKIQGRRVELEEIACAMRDHPGVDQAVVVAPESGGGPRQLHGYYTVSASGPMTAAELREHLVARLPGFMVPRHLVELPALPVTANGKLDRAALPGPPAPPASVLDPAARPSPECQALMEIWTEVLSTPVQDPDQDFFELGGDSMLAVRLTAAIDRKLGTRMSLASIMSSRTVRRMAELLVTPGLPAAQDSPLVVMRAAGRQRPFFAVHPIGGSVFCYNDLVSALPEVPFYGLQSLGIEAVRREGTVAEMAHLYLREVRRVQAAGPYVLGGWSFGGVVAHEMMRQLEAEGEKDGRLLMIDSYLLEDPRRYLGRSDDELLAMLLLDLARQRRPGQPELERTLTTTGAPSAQDQLERAIALGLVPEGLTMSALEHIFQSFKSNALAYASFAPGKIQASVELLVAGDQRFVGSPAQVDRWLEFCLGQRLSRTTDADHYSMLRGQSLSEIARTIRVATS